MGVAACFVFFFLNIFITFKNMKLVEAFETICCKNASFHLWK